jgi:hypothetical protein
MPGGPRRRRLPKQQDRGHRRRASAIMCRFGLDIDEVVLVVGHLLLRVHCSTSSRLTLEGSVIGPRDSEEFIVVTHV